jgi:putative transposase
MTDVTQDRDQDGTGLSAADEQLLRELTERARTGGLKLTGEGGLLGKLTKMVVEGALEGELDDHLGYSRHDPAGRDGGNSRNGHRAKTVLTEAGPVEISVPRDRDSSFEPKIVAKRQRRLTGIDDLVISLSAKGLTHGEIAAHLAEVYGAEVSKQAITTITDRVMEGLAEWQSRPLDPVYAVIFIDAINVKIREGQVANRPIYLVGLDYWILPRRTSRLGSSLSDHFGCLPACTLSAQLPDGADPAPGIQGCRAFGAPA